MAITSVKEMFTTDRGTRDEAGYRFTVGWLVVTDSHKSGAYEVLNAPKIPKQGEKHRSGKSVCESVNADKYQESDLYWLVTAEYAPLPPSTGNGGGEGDTGVSGREVRKPTLQIEHQRGSRFIEYDYNGIAISNVLGQKFETLPDRDVSDMTLTFSATIPFERITEQLIFDWRDVVHGERFEMAVLPNLKAAMDKGVAKPRFFGFPSFMPRLVNFGAATIQEPASLINPDQTSVTRWQVNLTVLISETWLGSQLNDSLYNGPAVNFGSSAAPESAALTKRNLDGSGLPSVVRKILNATGAVTTVPHFVFFQQYRHANLNDLFKKIGLPTTLAGYRVNAT